MADTNRRMTGGALRSLMKKASRGESKPGASSTPSGEFRYQDYTHLRQSSKRRSTSSKAPSVQPT